MSTHRAQCVVCDRPTLCTNTAHALGAQGSCYGSEPSIAFCSMACFRKLQTEMATREEWVKRSADAGQWEFSNLLNDPRPAPAIVEPAGPIFAAYPQDVAAYIDEQGDVVIRQRWLYGEHAREFAQWILDNVPAEDAEDSDDNE